MKACIFLIACLIGSFFCMSQEQHLNSDSLLKLPVRNQQVLDTAVKYGRTIAPSYESPVCTEFVIGVLGHFMELTSEDTVNIRIDQPRENLKKVYRQIENGSPYPTGVVHALVSKGKGIEILERNAVLPGDFVQFW